MYFKILKTLVLAQHAPAFNEGYVIVVDILTIRHYFIYVI